jgi:hypothetical protein
MTTPHTPHQTPLNTPYKQRTTRLPFTLLMKHAIFLTLLNMDIGAMVLHGSMK